MLDLSQIQSELSRRTPQSLKDFIVVAGVVINNSKGTSLQYAVEAALKANPNSNTRKGLEILSRMVDPDKRSSGDTFESLFYDLLVWGQQSQPWFKSIAQNFQKHWEIFKDKVAPFLFPDVDTTDLESVGKMLAKSYVRYC